ncbi:MAG: GNAT family N-acetyltransferase [Candidatus Bipolaricaulis sp.]|nr:GNAT family N-acetyltransferase [Candidatus Bipolaricaulis sp.]
MPNPTIEAVRALDVSELAEILRESEALGYRFLRRLVEEWQGGTNRFEGPGEALFVARVEGRLVGVCGLNRDPYASEPRVGRVRHLYVAQEWRGRGVGAALVRHVIQEARGAFDVLRLRAADGAAGFFFARLGFVPTSDIPGCTHLVELRGL